MELVEALLQNFSLGIWFEDKKEQIRYSNKKFREFLKLNEIQGKNLYKLLNLLDIRFEKFKINNYLSIKLTIGKEFLTARRYEIKDEKNECIGFIGVIGNEENQYLKNVMDSIPFIISYKDVEGNLIGCNKAFEKFVGIQEQELIGRGYLEKCDNKDLVLDIFNRDKEFEHDIRNKSYEIRYLGENVMKVEKYPLINKKGQFVGTIGMSEDVSEDKILQNKIIEASYRDTVTGLYNRNYFEKIVDELNRGYEKDFLLMMGDSDGLKVINDALGHLEGDRYLKITSELILKAVDNRGDVIRWGGDEFIILIPGGSAKEGKKIINKINFLSENYKKIPIPISISIGYSVRKCLNKTIEDMINEAEDIVYKEKVFKSEKIKEKLLDYLQKAVIEKSTEAEKYKKRNEKIVERIVEKLKLSESQIENINLALKYHDIGMVAVPNELLVKDLYDLTEEEANIVRSHVEKGYRIVKTFPEIARISKIVLTHHEYYNGEGYPLGLKGESIPIESRIIRVIDCYDFYRSQIKGISEEEILEKIKGYSGTKYDPKIVDIFFGVMNEMKTNSK